MRNEIMLYGEYDVVVAGGGVSGSAAAVAAARNGAKTLVIEQNAYLGGTATEAMVGMLIGVEREQKGIISEIMQRLAAWNATSGYYVDSLIPGEDIRVGKVVYHPEFMKIVLDEMLTESGAEVLFHTRFIGADTKNGLIKSIIVHNHSGLTKIKGKVFIDATFHGHLAYEAGCRWEMGRDEDGALQPGTLMFRMGDIDAQSIRELPAEEKENLINKGLAEGRLFTNYLSPYKLNEVYRHVFFNASRVPVNPLDAGSLSRAEIEGRKQVQRIIGFLSEQMPHFDIGRFIGTGNRLGLRDSRRIVGKYVLCREDIMSGRRFPDSIAGGSYPIDIHDPQGPGVTFVQPAHGKYYIPYRCLITDEVKNLILAGRCISATYEAHGSVRVMPICLQTGEAAGCGGALSVKTKQFANEMNGELISRMMQV